MARSRAQIVIVLFVIAVGGVLALVLGVNAYMHLTATPLHPKPEDIPSVAGTGPAEKWTAPVARAQEVVVSALAEQNLPGISVAVGVGGELVWAEGFGWADLENQTPVTPEMRFRVGTASKVLTSAAVGLLLEDKRLNLDDEIQTSVPEFPKKEWPVTLRQLMGHLAGVRTDGGDEGPYDERCERPVEALRIFADRSLLFEPGTRYRYSNYGWMLVSAAVEAAAGEPFYAFMRRQVFEPAGMKDTTADSLNEPIPNRATFYFPRYAADPKMGLHLMRPIDLSCYTGSSAFLSTPSDLVRFLMAINGGRLVQPATVGLLQTSQRLASGEETGYGLGWDVETITFAGEQVTIAGSDGDVLGGRTVSFWTFPQGIVVSVISNISYADTFAIAQQVAEVFAGEVQNPTSK